jgi:hypothetical protein
VVLVCTTLHLLQHLENSTFCQIANLPVTVIFTKMIIGCLAIVIGTHYAVHEERFVSVTFPLNSGLKGDNVGESLKALNIYENRVSPLDRDTVLLRLRLWETVSLPLTIYW